MRGSQQGRIPSELHHLIDTLDDIKDRLRTLEAPSGESINGVLPKLVAQQEKLTATQAELATLVEGIEATLSAFIATGIQPIVDAAVNEAVASAVSAAVASALGGNLTVNGSLTVTGAVVLPGARATGLASASSRVTAWIAGDGRLGHTAS